ncbi:hypothetical protein ABFS82_11G097200 [Erythranthe guttata]
MLQRAASNACSWWWASHIRTKQSKWLEQSMQDMEDKVHSMLKLIEEDGDSFAKRAEMYYKRRPELINSVEETYRAFKALADRYDLLSKELQNANHTIATVFPEQVQFDMDEDEDCLTPKKIPKNPQIIPTVNPPNVPKVPKAPIENLKGLISTAKNQLKKSSKETKVAATVKPVVKSGLSKDEALVEINKLHKDILALQTVKEFVKSSYESGLAKYWGIENQIMEMQDKVCRLQDEFDVETVIEDNEARTLMAEAALKSCQETLAALEEKQEKSTQEAKEEFKKIESAQELIKSIRRDYIKEPTSEEKPSRAEEGDANKTVSDSVQGSNVVSSRDAGPAGTLTVTELAEKIDELVNKVINLETAVSSQTVLINTLRTEADDLHAQIKNLQNEKETLIGDTQNLSARVKEMEDKLKRIQDLNKNVVTQNTNLQTNFAEARSSLDHLSEKLGSVKPDEEFEETTSSLSENEGHVVIKEEIDARTPTKDEKDAQVPMKDEKHVKESEKSITEEVKEVDTNVASTSRAAPLEKMQQEVAPKQEEGEGVKKPVKKTVTFLDEKSKEVVVDESPVKSESEKGETKKEGALNWQQMLLNGAEDGEKILIKEYADLLKNFKDVKKKLNNTEKKEKDSIFDITIQLRDLKQALHKRDQEIHRLHQQLNNVNNNNNNNNNSDNNNNNDVENEEKDRSVKPEEFQQEEEEDINSVSVGANPAPLSIIEEKLRLEIDAILDENLDFWLRFSTTFHQVQKFKSEVQDLQEEISKLKDKRRNQEGSITAQQKSEARPIYKHLREIQTELTVWLEQSYTLKDELKRRFASLCNIQEEIMKALNEGVEEEEISFSSHQAAKLQGEILNMKQENNKVREELQSGLDHVSTLQMEIDKTLRELNQEFGVSSDQPKQLQQSMSRSRVPLRSFIFGTKAKKQKHSLFSFMHPNRKFHVVRAGVPLSNQ